MPTPTLITIEGFDGTGDPPNIDEIRRRLWRDVDERFPDATRDDYDHRQDVRDYSVERFRHHLSAWFVAETHNKAVPAAGQYAELAAAAGAVVAASDSLYADLSKNTTINWLAAHHRYVLATCEARRLLTERNAAAQHLAETFAVRDLAGFSEMLYHQTVPADQRITVPDLDALKLDLANFVETSTERFALLRATVTGGFPDGFQPAGDRPARQGDEWNGQPLPASDAVAAQQRGW